ncbi:hypothetical protein [Nocardia spumae]|uniref:hypothetical protein n=1 Tax=Nocardia spumae TaxID=2887190 RepID=UPI001D134364|nr:hypothetical protein [Nocardia spumae]
MDRLEHKLDLILAHLGIPDSAALPGYPALDYGEIDALLSRGKKIQAIKIYRELVPGTGLAEAKRAVEAREGRV